VRVPQYDVATMLVLPLAVQIRVAPLPQAVAAAAAVGDVVVVPVNEVAIVGDETDHWQ
jgi:hypothetical protein